MTIHAPRLPFYLSHLTTTIPNASSLSHRTILPVGGVCGDCMGLEVAHLVELRLIVCLHTTEDTTYRPQINIYTKQENK